MTLPKFNFKERVNKESKNYVEEFDEYVYSCDESAEINIKGFIRGSKFTVDLICELLESDEWINRFGRIDWGLVCADFIRNNCKESKIEHARKTHHT